MDATKRAASVLRAAARRHLQRGADLILQADELDPPKPVDHAARSICGACGTEYRGREYGPGQRCEACDEAGQTGYLRRVKAEYHGICTTCAKPVWGESHQCRPDEVLVTTDGRSLGVTRDELAASQAGQDAEAEWLMGADLDALDALGLELDMASTYRGGRAS